jgi:hypothetical protein
MNGSEHLVLQDASLTNNGTITANNGTVVLAGTSNNSSLNGTSAINLYNLTINKPSNNATLSRNLIVNNNLTISSGKLELGNFDLRMGDAASFSGINKDRYIQTNGIGVLKRKVGNSWTPFPVGKANFNPARLKNSGTVDIFSIRVIDKFYMNGTSGSIVNTNVVPKTWLIDEQIPGGSNVSMRLIWRPSHSAGGFDPNNSHITHYTSGQWKDQTTGAYVADNSYSSDHRYREAAGITGFSPFGVKSGSPLPIELLYFHAYKFGDFVRLDWQTAVEINNDHFEVEWSKDGWNFEKIGEVEGAGNTTDIQFYDFLHRYPVAGANYYRLKQVDYDGLFEYTNIIQVDFIRENIPGITLFPNPVTDNLQVRLSRNLTSSHTGTALIFNTVGQIMKTVSIDEDRISIDVSRLAAGHYILKIQDNSANNYVEQFIKH